MFECGAFGSFVKTSCSAPSAPRTLLRTGQALRLVAQRAFGLHLQMHSASGNHRFSGFVAGRRVSWLAVRF